MEKEYQNLHELYPQLADWELDRELTDLVLLIDTLIAIGEEPNPILLSVKGQVLAELARRRPSGNIRT